MLFNVCIKQNNAWRNVVGVRTKEKYEYIFKCGEYIIRYIIYIHI